MTDVFERPAIHVTQSPRPRIPTTPILIRSTSNDGGSRPDDGGSSNSSASAALRMTHAAELKAATASVAGEFSRRRISAVQGIEAEFACKIAAAIMFGAPDTQHSAVAALRAEQAAKTAATLAQIAGEQRAARVAMVAPLRARQAAERKALASQSAPKRPGGRSSTRFQALKTMG